MYYNRNYILFSLLYFTYIFLFSCKENQQNNSSIEKTIPLSKKVDLDLLHKKLNEKFDSNATSFFNAWDGDSINQLAFFKEIYKEGTPYWFNERGLNTQAIDLINEIKDLTYDGIDTSRYNISKLETISQNLITTTPDEQIFSYETKLSSTLLLAIEDLILGAKKNSNKEIKNPNDSLWSATEIFKLTAKSNDIHQAFEKIRPQHKWYPIFRNEYKLLSQNNYELTSFSGLKDSIKIGDSSLSIKQLKKKLFIETKSNIDTTSFVWEQNALDALKKYQYQNGIKVSGKIDSTTLNKLKAKSDEKLKKLALNMERMRWLKHDFKQPYVWVAIPQMVLYYFDHDSIEFTMNVVIGRPSRPTPGIDSKIENIVFSPPWVVPPTIMREEVVPGIARRGGAYLARRGLRAYDRRGKPVPSSAINSSNFRNFSISQAPGYNSSLGEVKFNMPNPWSIYMHDTPHREDFVKSNRALSSGCVRLQRPKDFATFILNDNNLYSYNKIDSICKTRRTIFVPIKRNIDVHFVYLTNAVDSADNVLYLKDIYKWD